MRFDANDVGVGRTGWPRDHTRHTDGGLGAGKPRLSRSRPSSPSYLLTCSMGCRYLRRNANQYCHSCFVSMGKLYRPWRSSDSLRAGRPRNSSPGRVKNVFHVIQTGSGAYPASYIMGTWELLSLGYSGRGVKLTTHLQLVLRSQYVDIYIRSPIRLHGVVKHRDSFACRPCRLKMDDFGLVIEITECV